MSGRCKSQRSRELIAAANNLEQAIIGRLDLAAWNRAETTEQAERESMASILSAWPGISGQASKYSEGAE